jgi:hypothetical protein
MFCRGLQEDLCAKYSMQGLEFAFKFNNIYYARAEDIT